MSCAALLGPRFPRLVVLKAPYYPRLHQPCTRYSWFILVAFLLTAAFWVRQSDRGLRYYPASLIMPLMQASSCCSGGWGVCLGW